jgi:hypothetical protein
MVVVLISLPLIGLAGQLMPVIESLSSPNENNSLGRKVIRRVGARVRILRGNLMTMLPLPVQRACIPGSCPNNDMFYGRTTAGTAHKCYSIQFDILSEGNQIIHEVTPGRIYPILDGEEEVLLNVKVSAAMIAEEVSIGEEQESGA